MNIFFIARSSLVLDGLAKFATFAISPFCLRSNSPFQFYRSTHILRRLRIMTTPPGTAETRELVLPANANHYGTLFAGQALQLMAKAAFLAARGAAQADVVMARVTGVDFLSPVPVGRQLCLRAWVSRIGRCSMTVCVSGVADQPRVPAEEVLKGVFEMVAVDQVGRPVPIESPSRVPSPEDVLS